MAQTVVQELPYRSDSAELFGALMGQPWPVFLDSCRPYCTQGRYDIITADPVVRLVTRGPETEIRSASRTEVSTDDPFTLVQRALGAVRHGAEGLPFCGGAVGYFGYDLARRLERLPNLAADAERIPDMGVGIYDWALVVDHHQRRSRLVTASVERARAVLGMLSAAPSRSGSFAARGRFRVTGPVRCNLDRADYFAALSRIQRYLREGDCYQVNLARRFAASTAGDPWDAYRQLRELNAAPYGAYLDTGECQVMSSSPERFLRVRGGEVETSPIKGTCRRSRDRAEDALLAERLSHSAKDRAENVMIVDLLRNDLGKVCAVGSVQVPRLFAIESFARVHHLVSTVRGRLAEGRTALDLLRACFPGGSITGAPKIRAMQIIEELEPNRRGVYCGAIGYVGFDGSMDTNIAIRTLVHSHGVTRFWAGGGIVADSEPELEYEETYHKAAPLLDLLERSGGESSAR